MFLPKYLAVVSALLVSLSVCSGAPLRGNSVTQRDGQQEEEGGLQQVGKVGKRVSRGLFKKDTTAGAETQRRMKKGKGGGLPGECKASKKGSLKGDCTLWDLITARADEFSVFIEAVEKASLIPEKPFVFNLQDPEKEYTIFVPTNQAFQKSPELYKYFDLESWTASHIMGVVDFHILDKVVPSEDFVDGQVLLEACGCSDTEQDVTVNLSKDNPPLLEGLFLPDSGINIIEVDNVATNGVFHVVDEVIPSLYLTVDIISAASVARTFTKFVELLQIANLESWLQLPGPIHIFPIPDAIFDAMEGIGGPRLYELLKIDPNLRQFLENHIIIGERLPCFEGCGGIGVQSFTSLAGNPIDIDLTKATVNGVPVARDVLVNNGSIDVLQGMVLPPGELPIWMPEQVLRLLQSLFGIVIYNDVLDTITV